ncbi:hypothetical protein [Bradyrhizobium sp. Cp5.3]|uniref:hypothetical protein n=1 Tax=Bradyrhizobium sp. Cp5.3 TaxID=443598 RepID=UPI000400BC3F|nr:hypothetical protein [Bradyrhizobium sp. Cp5.3]
MSSAIGDGNAVPRSEESGRQIVADDEQVNRIRRLVDCKVRGPWFETRRERRSSP